MTDRTCCLVVDDDADYRRFVRQTMAAHPDFDSRLLEADTLTAAGRCLDTSTVDVILLSLGLPDADGLAWFDREKGLRDLPPVVGLTETATEMASRRAIAAGLQDVLVKSACDGPLLVRTV